MRSFLRFYRWHIIFILLILVCVLWAFGSATTKVEPDLVIGYTGTAYVNEQAYSDNQKTEIDLLLHDATGDGKKSSVLNSYTLGSTKDSVDVMEQMIENEYHIYIAPREVFEAIKDKSVFATLNIDDDNVEKLSTYSGRIYAVSVDGNSVLKRLGFVKTDGLFIAAADFKGENLTTFEKNGINITTELIKSRKKYNN